GAGGIRRVRFHEETGSRAQPDRPCLGSHPRSGTRAHHQDPQPVPVSPASALPECPPASGPDARGVRPISTPSGNRTGCRCRPYQHVVMDGRPRDMTQKKKEKLKKRAKSRLQTRRIGVLSRRSLTPLTREDGSHGRVSMGRQGCQTAFQTIASLHPRSCHSSITSLVKRPVRESGRGCDPCLSCRSSTSRQDLV